MGDTYTAKQQKEIKAILGVIPKNTSNKKFRRMCYQFVNLVAAFLKVDEVQLLTEFCKGYATNSDIKKHTINLEALFQDELRVLLSHISMAQAEAKGRKDDCRKYLKQCLLLIEVPFLAHCATSHVFQTAMADVSISPRECFEFSKEMLGVAKTKEDVILVLAGFCFAFPSETYILRLAHLLR